MNIIGTVSRKAFERNLPFILIGGHAVMAHGFVRTTADLDFLVRKSQSVAWAKLLEELQFTIHFSGPTFLQFNPPPGEISPLDLMFVSDETFSQMLADIKRVETDDGSLNVVSLPNLFALKCHALRNRPHRAIKDIEDLVQLARINKLDLNEPGWRAIVVKHGGQELYELLKRERESGAA